MIKKKTNTKKQVSLQVYQWGRNRLLTFSETGFKRGAGLGFSFRHQIWLAWLHCPELE